MKVVLFVLVIVGACWADNCNNSFETFLNALKDEVTNDANVQGLEQENVDDYETLVGQCFASTSDDDNKCGLTSDELHADVYGDDGPLRGCPRCQTLVRGVVKKIMESSDDTRKCFRRHFAEVVRSELEPCIQYKTSKNDFHVPPVPDFDEKTSRYMSTVEKGIGYRIMAKSRLDMCGKRNSNKAAQTEACLKNGYSGIYSKHCHAAQAAKSRVPQSCNGDFRVVKTATCDCMEEKRKDWHDRFDQVQSIVTSATSASQCAIDISKVLGSWLGEVQKALSDCLPNGQSVGNGNTRDLKTLIELGCGQVINGGVQTNELTTGFRFLRLFLDALNDRITVFCDKNCRY